MRAARIAAQHGARVALAEEYRLGGTCVIRGCVPKKLLVYASRFHGEFEDAAGFGWTVPHATFDWATLIANKDKEIARLEKVYGTLLEKPGVKVFKSSRHAGRSPYRAIGKRRPHPCRIYPDLLPAERQATAIGFRDIEHAISSNEAFHLAEFPRRIVIQGGGYIAVEFAGIFAGLGSHVTLVYRGENILRGFDDDVRSHLRMEMEKRGIRVVTGRTIAAIEKTGEHYSAQDIGRQSCSGRSRHVRDWPRAKCRANSASEEVGVDIAKSGGIAVDEYSRTSVANIYAVGDVTNRINLTPVAIREGHAFADTVFGGKPTIVDHARRADRGILRA